MTDTHLAAASQPVGEEAITGYDDRHSGSRTTSVYEQLRVDIVSGLLRPGEKLRAETLRKRFMTAGSPVREALNRLLSEGFVVLEDQKGFRVAPVSKDELAELVQTRIWIDGMAIRASVERFDKNWEENLVLALHRLSRVARGDDAGSDTSEWAKLHKAFHLALVSGCGSRWMIRISEQLFDSAERYRLITMKQVAERNELDEHRAIFEACINRDIDRAIELLKHHYGQTFDAIVESGAWTR